MKPEQFAALAYLARCANPTKPYHDALCFRRHPNQRVYVEATDGYRMLMVPLSDTDLCSTNFVGYATLRLRIEDHRSPRNTHLTVTAHGVTVGIIEGRFWDIEEYPDLVGLLHQTCFNYPTTKMRMNAKYLQDIPQMLSATTVELSSSGPQGLVRVRMDNEAQYYIMPVGDE